MKRHVLIGIFLLANAAYPQTVVNGRPSMVLEGEVAQLVVDLGGGSITDFHLKDQPLDPLVWNEDGDQDEARPMSHFLCLDRWGQPSEAEALNGMPFHGEATRVRWKEEKEPVTAQGTVEAQMSASLPMAGLRLRRRIRLSGKKAFFTVTEWVTNENPLGRVYNMVQHPTIGPPFLDETTLVDSNARKGLMQSSPLPNPEEPAVHWPMAFHGAEPVDLRRLSDNPHPRVVSFTVDQDYGWVTAATPGRELLIGYLWKTEDYPWLNIWRHVENGKPLARGLEFGTTGLHQPFPTLVKKGRIFGRLIFDYLDAGGTVERSYMAFLFKIPKDYRGVADVQYQNENLVIHERGQEGGANPGRELRMRVGRLLSRDRID